MSTKKETNKNLNYTLDEAAQIFSVHPSELIEMAKRGAIDLCVILNEKYLMRRVPCKLSEKIILINKDDKLNHSRRAISFAWAATTNPNPNQKNQPKNLITLADKNDPMVPYNYSVVSPGELVYLSRESCIELESKSKLEIRSFPLPDRIKSFTKEFKEVNNKSLYQIFTERANSDKAVIYDLLISKYAYNPIESFDKENPEYPDNLLDKNNFSDNLVIFDSLSAVFPNSFREALEIASELMDNFDDDFDVDDSIFNQSEFNFSMLNEDGHGSDESKLIIVELSNIISHILHDMSNEYTFDKLIKLASIFDLWIPNNQSEKILIEKSNVRIKGEDLHLIERQLNLNNEDKLWTRKILGKGPHSVIHEFIYREFLVALLKEGDVDRALKKLMKKIPVSFSKNEFLKQSLGKTGYDEDDLYSIAEKLLPTRFNRKLK